MKTVIHTEELTKTFAVGSTGMAAVCVSLAVVSVKVAVALYVRRPASVEVGAVVTSELTVTYEAVSVWEASFLQVRVAVALL